MKTINSYVMSTPTQVAGTHLMAVLTEDAHLAKAVYLAIIKIDPSQPISKEMTRAENFAKAVGSKQSYDHALSFFPSLKRREYRA